MYCILCTVYHVLYEKDTRTGTLGVYVINCTYVLEHKVILLLNIPV